MVTVCFISSATISTKALCYRRQHQTITNPSVANTTQVCTLPMTVKGLPRNAKKTEDWHEECCDGSNVCDCKDDIRLKKDGIDKCFLSEAEQRIRVEFELEAIWGLKVLLDNDTIRKMLEKAAQIKNQGERHNG